MLEIHPGSRSSRRARTTSSSPLAASNAISLAHGRSALPPPDARRPNREAIEAWGAQHVIESPAVLLQLLALA